MTLYLAEFIKVEVIKLANLAILDSLFLSSMSASPKFGRKTSNCFKSALSNC